MVIAVTNIENRKLEMLLRVREFGETHRDAFPLSSTGGQAFEALSAAIAPIGTHAVSKLTTTREGRVKKSAARAALLESLDSVSQCARVIARDQPGFGESFRLGRLRSNRTIITTGRAFVEEAMKSKSQFVALGLADTFISELNGLVDAFEQAIRSWEAGRDGNAAARASIDSGLSEALALLPKLDVIVANQFKNDSATLAVWERDRRFDRPRRGKRATSAPASATEPVQPVTAEPAEPVKEVA